MSRYDNIRVAAGLSFSLLIISFALNSCTSQYAKKEEVYVKPPGEYKSGSFSVLIYNIAGLPDFISKSHPAKNTELISPLLNRFDIVLLQEDFFYHRQLVQSAVHPYKSEKSADGFFFTGDGLNRLSFFPFYEYKRVHWKESYGIMDHDNDSLAPKGFSYAVHEIIPGVYVDIYNLHMDAGNGKGDSAARLSQMKQLIGELSGRNGGSAEGRTRAVIIGGDWNIKRKRLKDAGILDLLAVKTGYTDAAESLKTGEDRIDRVLFKNGTNLKLTPVSYRVERNLFVDENGFPLSDHFPVSVVFKWEYFPAGLR
ncbi:MAG: endonuclease [Spirochaetes bacterium]|nr:endonuclease [Spirochaetota bacterium]